MFFQRKSPVRSGNRRRTYRKRQCKAYALSVVLLRANGPLSGQFIDLSMGGVGAAFPVDRDPELAHGDVVELVVQSLSHGKVQTPARVVYNREVEGRRVRYGFEFVNAGNLYAQLDTFYARLFNRRSSMRVRPSLDRKVSLKLTTSGGRYEATIAEISSTGVGLVLAAEAGSQFEVGQRVGVEFQLPGTREPFRGHATLVSLRTTPERTVLGLAFDLDEPNGLAEKARALDAFISARAVEMERWESAWS
ncbi:MAG TPA: PilZ domain-containing protein [Planctomycetota bacterium]|nr:PilZ domain-containing protein [Planctomycetota bacterium]